MTEPSEWRPLPGHAAHDDEESRIAPASGLAAEQGVEERPAQGMAWRERLATLIAAGVAFFVAIWNRLRAFASEVADRFNDFTSTLIVKKQPPVAPTWQAASPRAKASEPARAEPVPLPLRETSPIAREAMPMPAPMPPAPSVVAPPFPPSVIQRELAFEPDVAPAGKSAHEAEFENRPYYGVPPGYPVHPRPELLLTKKSSRFRIIWSDPKSGEPLLGRVTAPLWAASDWMEARLRGLRWLEDRRSRIVAAGAGLLVGASAIALATVPGSSGTTVALAPAGDPKQAALEQAIHDYILNHPEIIPEAMERLRAKEMAKTIGENRAAIETPFAGAWAGAKDGDVTLIEFSDYSCGYCRASVADVDKLLAEDKRLKVVWREIPILGDKSEQAARLGLSAARQGRFLDFHRLMYATGVPDKLSMEKVQNTVGMDPAKTAKDIVDPAVQSELDHNVDLARTLGISGTPTFIIGDRLLSGAVGYAALKQAIEDARAKKG
ncbi:DsbA family protein [Flavisphingomonas formosensis]|uniref:DsbA family protein n=1 Tax=Flavisphingomonas formosensis TaxID=861534 RepID=UPI001E592418|nr:DsbA family protein [Sphingomonas formosensis]